jgi:hypothetical protein
MRAFPSLVIAALFCSLASAPAWAQVLQCNPRTHNFGNVPVGDSSSYSFQITNAGHKKLSIVSKAKQKAGPFSFGNFPLPLVIAPGASVWLPVIFKPTAAGQFDDVLALASTAPNPRVVIDVSGVGQSGAKAKLGISPASLNFGNVTVGSSASLQATLKASNASVTISSDKSTSSEFAILGLSLPLTIPAGKSISVTIQFTPSSSGKDPAKVGFISDAVDSPTVEPVTGTGVPSGSHDVYLSWNADKTAVGYNVYRGNAKAGPFEEINTALESSTNFTDSSVVGGATYYYATTAVNAAGEQSAYSNVTQAVIPD